MERLSAAVESLVEGQKRLTDGQTQLTAEVKGLAGDLRLLI